MPCYLFTVPSGGATLRHKAEVAAAMTKVHSEITDEPAPSAHRGVS
jgi:phenylpyruvate tautomerase PptA (4-oxalocrotonate tautomerase family)